ncbi:MULTISPECIES: SMP-30/gluconolactonase/LRE family protein [Myxococcus]|uniref:SMP-30/gluconolactonase/LRE family protein n=1 Tax=Myxococcus TaxID=32 RepID=UPI00114298FD|nr:MULTISPECIES: SMP-30/gluconolactonase/LRE family protein [Myxococcus]NOK04644.1 SMP-30/gluconolactonase/LRE family protein [Myxococcus xanthus]
MRTTDVARHDEARCIWPARAVLGEGPFWMATEGALYWLDIPGRKVHRLELQSGAQASWDTPLRIASLAPRRSGGFIAGTERGLAFYEPRSARLERLLDPEPERPHNRCNDGKVDPQGRFWVGTMDDREKAPTGGLYRFDAQGHLARIDEGYTVTNGPAFSPDGRTLYVNDSPRRVTYAFDLGPDGAATRRREFLRFDEPHGFPDGMTVDAEGGLWIAFYGGGCVRRFSPDGAWLAEYRLPVAKTTSVAFAGDALDRLFVTTGRDGLSAEELEAQPLAGGLFELTPGVRGVAPVPFAG